MRGPIRKLAIVGASARAAAYSAIRAGFQVVAADLFADADLSGVAEVTRVEDYPEGLADWLARTSCDAWLYTGALENHPGLIDRMADERPLLGNRGNVLRRVRDPMRLQAGVRDAGLLFPETRVSIQDIPRDGSWLCKTYAGASGSGVWRLDGETAAQRALDERAVAQRFVPGESAAAIFVIGPTGAQLLGVTRQLLGVDRDRPWQYVGSVGRLAYGAAIRDQLELLGEMLATTFQLRGLTGVDVVLADERVWVVEVNPRYSASVEILERALTKSAVAAHVAAFESNAHLSVPTEPAEGIGSPTRPVYGKSIVFARRPTTITPSFVAWAMERAGMANEISLADIPHPGEIIAAGRPILTAFASGSTISECEQRLQQRVAEMIARAESTD